MRMWLVGALVCVTVLSAGTVHIVPRLVIGAFAVALGVSAARHAPPRLAWTGVCLLLAGTLAGLSLVPVPHDVRSVLQPAFAELISAGQALGTPRWLPLSLAPHRTMQWLAWWSAMGALGFGVHTLVRQHRASWPILTLSVVASGVLTMLMAGVHQLVAPTAYLGLWTGGRPGDMFAPFFNPNHAATLLACSAVLAAGMAWRAERHRWPWLIASVATALGTVWTGSRAGPLLVVGGLVMLFALRGPRWMHALGTTAFVALGAWLGPDLLARWSEWREPGSTYHGLDGGRLHMIGDGVPLLTGAPLGVGPWGYSTAMPILKTGPLWMRVEHVHNDVIQLVFELGTPGALLVLAPIAAVLIGAYRRPDRAANHVWLPAVCVLLAAATFGFPIQTGALSMVGTLAFAVLAAQSRPRFTWALPHAPRALSAAAALAAVALTVGIIGSPARSIFGPRPTPPIDAHACSDLVTAHPLDARLLSTCSSHQPALPWLTHASHVDPTHPVVHWLLARAQRDAGQNPTVSYAAALRNNTASTQQFEALVRESAPYAGQVLPLLLPHAPGKVCDASDIFRSNGLTDHAEAWLRASAPKHPRCGVMLAGRALQAGDFRLASDVLASLPPERCGVSRLSARIALATNDLPTARIAVFHEAVACHKPDPTLPLQLAARGGDAEAVDRVEQLAAQLPHRSDLQRTRLYTLIDARRLDKAAQLLETWVLDGTATATEAELYVELSSL